MCGAMKQPEIKEESHALRRKEILKKHPEIKELMVHDPNFKWYTLGIIAVQFLSIPLVASLPWWGVLIGAYFIGGVLNHSLMLAIHEIAHGGAFGTGKVLANKLFASLVSLPVMIPVASTYKKYHMEHHEHQGDEEKDPDVPSRLEARMFQNTSTKILWVFLQPFFYMLRPLMAHPKSMSLFEISNVILTFAFDAAVMYAFGAKPIVYLLGGGLMAMGLHPMAGRFISEHYMQTKGMGTYSYYGPLNKITFNVGYHNEHHDFPNIPGSKLPLVKKLAPEYYDKIPSHDSWSKVLYDFITDPAVANYATKQRIAAGYDE